MISHIPARMSPALRDGIITASVTRECPQVIASTCNTRSCPEPTGTATGEMALFDPGKVRTTRYRYRYRYRYRGTKIPTPWTPGS
jgi:hypothetical protein